MSKENFKGKKVWITGASSGIGEALAYQFAYLGAELILSARNKEKCNFVAEKCNKFTEANVIPLDITNHESIEQAVKQVEKSGPLFLMLHNAGIAQKGVVDENMMDIERRIMETNYFGTVALTKAVLPLFKKQKEGWFAVVTSIAGIMGVPGRSIYSASKHALHGFFESMRAEVFLDNIRISIIMPGFINTDITVRELKGDGQYYGELEKSHKLGMDVNRCAQIITRKLKKDRKNIIVGGFEITGVYLQRFAPGLYRRMIRNHPMKRWRAIKQSLGFSKA